jgi:two-component system, OmpR family, response regulator
MSPGSKVHKMSSPSPITPAGVRRILVADEDREVVEFIIRTLREDGHEVFHAYDGLSAVELAVALEDRVDLIISNTRVSGLPGVQLIYQLRTHRPDIPIMYIANIDRSTPAIEAKLPRDIPIIREPFTAEQLRAMVNPLLRDTPGMLDVGR